MSSLVAYTVEKRSAEDPSRFGRGAIEGVAGPESANNAAATSSFIPLLTLGLPANATMAVLYGALLLQGIPPGPELITEHPDVFWGVVNSMYLGNILLLLLSIPLIGLFVRVLKVRPAILAPITVLITMIGVYSIRNNAFDMFLVIALGLLGYGMKKLGFEPGPFVLAFVLAFVLGKLLESSFRRSMRLFDGDVLGFFQRPLSASLAVAFILITVAVPALRLVRARQEARTPHELDNA
jgi:putative tricarboxylic transport membrane protein